MVQEIISTLGESAQVVFAAVVGIGTVVIAVLSRIAASTPRRRSPEPTPSASELVSVLSDVAQRVDQTNHELRDMHDVHRQNREATMSLVNQMNEQVRLFQRNLEFFAPTAEASKQSAIELKASVDLQEQMLETIRRLDDRLETRNTRLDQLLTTWWNEFNRRH